jgi:FkbM family methyltransferase
MLASPGLLLISINIPDMKPKSNLFKSLSYVIGRFLLNKKYMIAYSPKYDLHLKFITQDGGGRAIYKTGLYEERLTHFILEKLHLTSNDLVFDVGANIGWYSNLLGKHKPDAQIHSFEPDPTNFEILSGNLERNNIKNVHLNNVGVGEKEETLKLYLYKKSNIGRHSMLDINDGPFIEVPIVSLDEYIRSRKLSFENLRFLKIDIEGFEYFAFLGATEFLKHVPIILAEFSPGYMRKGHVDPAKLLTLLRTADFSPFVIDGLDLLPITDEELLGRNDNINLLWIKNGHSLN